MRRVKRPADKRDLLDTLTDSDEGGPFGSHVDAMIFAASLGARKGRTEPIESSEEPMVFELFARQADREALFYLLGIHQNENLDLLRTDRSDDLVTAFEEYANGGLEVIQNEISRTGHQPKEAILNLLHEAQRDIPDDEPELEQIADQIGFD